MARAINCSSVLNPALLADVKLEAVDQPTDTGLLYGDLGLGDDGGGGGCGGEVKASVAAMAGGRRMEMIEGSDVYWSSSSSTTPSAPASIPPPPTTEQHQQVDIYRDLILRHLVQDIGSTCAKLCLPTNPLLWDVDDCVKWVGEMCLQFQLYVPSKLQLLQTMPALQFGGRWMMSMGPEEFSRCVPDGGDILHTQVQLWKTAFESAYGQQRDVGQLKAAGLGCQIGRGVGELEGEEPGNRCTEDVSSNASTSHTMGSAHQHDSGDCEFECNFQK